MYHSDVTPPRVVCGILVFVAMLVLAASSLGAFFDLDSLAGLWTSDPSAGLAVSEDGRKIVTADGRTFFWLGDTAWELFHRLDRDEARLYLEDRAGKGFTVIQAVILAELEGLTTPNANGDLPLHDMDPTKPNEAYFEHVDYIVAQAADLGLYVGMLPTWGDKFNLKWGVGPEIFTPANARVYGEFVGRRYANAPVIWILGGDRAPEESEDLAIIRAMAEGIRKGDRGRNLMTYHPQGGRKSWEWFGNDPWLDLNFYQSGHGSRDYPNYEVTAIAYTLNPAKPVIDGEPRYEDHPVNWQPDEGWFDDFDVRQAGYWSVLAGAAGHTYGNHNVWQMWEPGRHPISAARAPWRDALDHAGAAQMGHMKRLFLSRPFLSLVPDKSVVRSQPGGPAHIHAARDARGRYLIAYSPYGFPLEIDASSLAANRLTGWWFDPRSGRAQQVGADIDRSESLTFTPPGKPARGNDWVLVLDNTSAHFEAPGSGADRP